MITEEEFEKAKDIELEIEELKIIIHNLQFKTTFDSKLERVSHEELIEQLNKMMKVKIDQFKLIVTEDVK